ncbi:MAG: DUF4105 domain-containing protein [Candidatus Woesearchaeota archaeon]|nr:DUF4105 domain-containing protein [Candidatus Woesearchaeota archaeon]
MKLYKYVILTAILLFVVWQISLKPSNDRNWSPDQTALSYGEIDGNLVHLYNIRNFTYTTTDDYEIKYYDKTYDLNKLDSVWFIVEPFSAWQAAAHTFLSFGFGDEYVAISVEIRKTKGQTFNPFLGLFRQYETTYVIGDEQDLIKLRSNYRKDTVYLYPINAPQNGIQEMFIQMINRANKLKEQPEFYNTITNSCTTAIVHHINSIAPNEIPFNWKILLPGYSDKYAYDLGWIKTDLPFEQTREKYKINEKALKYADSPDFSQKIRE